ncbi:unnamed protein product [Dimorphilus gyrociliatus]|uniref:Uncharacterized protein n=1 Tax=Dimorphilus gyrociliatus TaxID=2664684 RepID=A0A7I8WE05_9ANNE|nr:unnamed protein product [Dimorphilus gyrociliatus]
MLLYNCFFFVLAIKVNYIFCGYFDDECDVIVSERVRVGEMNISASQCTIDEFESYNCFDENYGCYKPKYAVPGFTYKNGVLDKFDSANRIYELEAQNPKLCAKYCLEDSNCQGFTVVNTLYSNRLCFKKLKAFFKGTLPSHLPSQMRSYDRIAYVTSTCQQGFCQENYKNEGNKDFFECRTICANGNTCSQFTIGTSSCLTSQHCQFKPIVGDKITCTSKPEILSPKSLYNDKTSSILLDSDTSTCIDIKFYPYIIRFPFPGVGKLHSPFNIEISGTSLNCLNEMERNILVYVPFQSQFDVTFFGKFKLCEISLSSKTECKYSCSCGDRFCEGVYIYTFHKIQPVELCEIKFL